MRVTVCPGVMSQVKRRSAELSIILGQGCAKGLVHVANMLSKCPAVAVQVNDGDNKNFNASMEYLFNRVPQYCMLGPGDGWWKV
jgi:hypothetical protein